MVYVYLFPMDPYSPSHSCFFGILALNSNRLDTHSSGLMNRISSTCWLLVVGLVLPKRVTRQGRCEKRAVIFLGLMNMNQKRCFHFASYSKQSLHSQPGCSSCKGKVKLLWGQEKKIKRGFCRICSNTRMYCTD